MPSAGGLPPDEVLRNPQNVGEPLFVPEPSLSALEVVEGHLEALQAMDSPWTDHGVHVRAARAGPAPSRAPPDGA